jgi:hypothetical protein
MITLLTPAITVSLIPFACQHRRRCLTKAIDCRFRRRNQPATRRFRRFGQGFADAIRALEPFSKAAIVRGIGVWGGKQGIHATDADGFDGDDGDRVGFGGARGG